MENDKLTQLWNLQKNNSSDDTPENIIKLAKKQRSNQFISIGILSITVVILIAYTIYCSVYKWNNFTIGLLLMISSLVFRIMLEFVSLHKKERQLISLDNKSFQKYLEKHFQLRKKINYIITPLCFAVYTFGFTLLLPYFKQEFSKGFYTYLLISGFLSIFIIAVIVFFSIKKEHKGFETLREE
ncbi:hypothetical protein EV195_11011 [Tenacibaculum skagerrakense]|uniref:DUF3278 domain-containing protein n=1 Tax=Tenacibaculum skagerrakense TaxID=186571 RepID=A0A4R2NNM2_9FLAO|nr:hypothetical protein [Tenacibaculum skagerrakense]TCP22884.1 hypothetical protein EV195_11011 [Tenacibaculum skagerrakense]